MSDGPHDSDRERPVPEHGAGDHLDHATLADLREGILESSAARAAENHLAGCEACAADDRALAAIPSLLAASGSVGPMPADVARRLDEALAAEPRIPVEAAATVTPLASRSADARQQVRGMRLLQAAAVLVVIMLGVGIAVGYGGGGGSSEDSGGAVSGAARDSSGQAEAGAGSFPVTSSGRAWTKDTLAASVPALIDGLLTPKAASAPGADSESAAPGGDTSGSAQPDLSRQNGNGAAARLSGGPALEDCVTQLNGAPATPLSVDLGTWSGKPAAVIVLPTEGDAATVDIFVVAPGCPPGELLYFTRAARP